MDGEDALDHLRRCPDEMDPGVEIVHTAGLVAPVGGSIRRSSEPALVLVLLIDEVRACDAKGSVAVPVDEHRGHSDDADWASVTACRVERLPKDAIVLPDGIQTEIRELQVASETRHPPERRWCAATEPDGHGTLDRRRDDPSVSIPIVASVVRDGASVQGRAHDRHGFLETGGAFGTLDIEAVELLDAVASPKAEIEATLRDHINDRRILGEAHGIMEGRQVELRPDPDPTRPRRDGRPDRQEGRAIAIGYEVVFGEPHLVQAKRLGTIDEPERRCVDLGPWPMPLDGVLEGHHGPDPHRLMHATT